MLNATIIGQYFLSKNPELTDIQIQKLVYYAYSWYMVKNNGKKLFEENPQAWIHGPVFRTLFDNMKNYKNFSQTNQVENIDKDVTDFLDVIFNIYGKYSGNELEKLTHSELPWIKARNGLKPHEFSQNIILDEDILKCYGG
jgi:uncharacterized phage-associated protein